MKAERLAEIRDFANNQWLHGFDPGTVRELLDHIAQLEARPEWTDLSMTKCPSDPTLAVAYHDGYNDCAARSKAFYEARIAQLEAHKAESMQVFASLQIQEIAKEIGAPLGSGVAEHILPWIKTAKAQLEAQRGKLARELDLTKREAWTAKERHKDEKDRADGLRERLDELSAEEFARAQRGVPERAAWLTIDEMEHVIERGYPVFTIDAPRIERIPHNIARALAEAIAAASVAKGKEQRGGAVVVPELTESDIDAIWRDVEDINDAPRAMAAWAYRLAASRIQPIPAKRVLADGMVGVNREELMYLHAFEKYARKHGPESIQDVAGTLDHLRSAQQAKGE